MPRLFDSVVSTKAEEAAASASDMFDVSGMFHWCLGQSIEAATLVSCVLLKARQSKVPIGFRSNFARPKKTESRRLAGTKG